MTWRGSLVKIASYQVEQLRRRLGEIVERRVEAELRLALLHAEAEAEGRRTEIDAEAGWYRLGYFAGWRARRDETQAEIEALLAEEAGARDAIAEAFEELKKYEQIQQGAHTAERHAQAKAETAEMDALGGRRASK